MSQKEFEQGLRSIYELLLERAPEQHRLRTPQCPPLHRLSNVSEKPLGPAELEHVHACTYCQKIISMGQALDVPTDDKVNMPAKAMENADRRVSQRKDDPGKAPLLPSWLSRRLQGGVGKVKIKIEVAPGYSVEYIESFYSSDEADALLRALLAVEMTPEVIRMYGRDTVTKRRSEQYGADYNYNPTAKKPREWTPLMLSIRERMESVAGPTIHRVSDGRGRARQ